MTRQREFAAPLGVELRPIAVVRAPQFVHHDAPRQPRVRGVAPGTACGEIHVAQGLQNCLHDLAGFSHLWVLFWFHHSRGWNSKVMPPRDRKKRGLFATRAPARPNPIGLSLVELLRVDKRVLTIGDHDLLDGTPILDIKPYLPYCDSVPDARIGYVDDFGPQQQDHRPWWTEKAVEPPRVYRRRRRDDQERLPDPPQER